MATVPASPAVRPDHNSLGKAAFITGLIALVLSFVPLIGFVSWLLGPLAVLLGLIALLRPSRSLAIVGIICGVLTVYVCVSWIKAAQSVGKAMSADTFNNSGGSTDNATAPIMTATVRGIWADLDANKIAAGKKYGGHRLLFVNEKIDGFQGKADSPEMTFVGKEDRIMIYTVAASFSPADGSKITTLKKGQAISFVCQDIGETIGDGYSLDKCALK